MDTIGVGLPVDLDEVVVGIPQSQIGDQNMLRVVDGEYMRNVPVRLVRHAPAAEYHRVAVTAGAPERNVADAAYVQRGGEIVNAICNEDCGARFECLHGCLQVSGCVDRHHGPGGRRKRDAPCCRFRRRHRRTHDDARRQAEAEDKS